MYNASESCGEEGIDNAKIRKEAGAQKGPREARSQKRQIIK